MGSSQELHDEASALAERVASALDGRTAATAESVTSGHIGSCLAAAPNAGQWFQGTVVAYAQDVKFTVLGVPPGEVVTVGCASQMALGVSRLMGADVSVSSTGVGGPGEAEGQPPGTVFIGVATSAGCQVREYHFDGEPPEVVQRATVQALRDLRAVLDKEPTIEQLRRSDIEAIGAGGTA